MRFKFRSRLGILVWKEVMETLRDKRTIGLMALSALLLPALGLLIGGLRSQQVAPVEILVCDNGAEALMVAKKLYKAFESAAAFTPSLISNTTSCNPRPGYVFAVIIPNGFSANASTINAPILVEYRTLVGSVAASQAEGIANNVLYEYSQKKASSRVKVLAEKAGISVDPGVVLHPVRVVKEAVTAQGAQAPPGLQERIQIARFLSFSVFFVLNPAAIAVADSFIRERERGTAELVASSPTKGREIVLSKVVGGLVLSLIAAAVDGIAVLIYILLLSATPSALTALTPDLALIHAVEILLAVLVTAALSAPIALTAPTPRAATLGSSLLTGLATAVFFASLFVDLDKLPLAVFSTLLIIPYTHTVLAITAYAMGDIGRTLIHSGVIIALTGVLLLVSAKLYNPEKYVRRL